MSITAAYSETYAQNQAAIPSHESTLLLSAIRLSIANGHIDIDDRTWGTAYRGPLAIHASKRFHSGYHFYLREILRLPVPDVQDLDYGGVIAVAELVDCLPPGAPTDVPIHRRAHGGGHCHGLVLKDVQKVQFVPCKGKQGMFTLDLPELQPATLAPAQDKLF